MKWHKNELQLDVFNHLHIKHMVCEKNIYFNIYVPYFLTKTKIVWHLEWGRNTNLYYLHISGFISVFMGRAHSKVVKMIF